MKILFEVSQADIGAGTTRFQWQKGRGNYLALAGSDHLVAIFNRQGERVAVITLPGVCTSLDWDKDGEVLAITQDFHGMLYFWNSNTMETSKIDTGVKEGLSLCLWAFHSHSIAIGTAKGTLVFFNYRNKKKLTVLGKHSRRIHSGAWSVNNILALAAEDKSITLSDKDGNTITQSDVKLDVNKGSLKFSPDGNRLTAVSGSKMLYLFDVDEGTQPYQLIFQARYGEITTHVWIDDNQISLGFSKGYMVMISRETGSIGEEVFQTRNHKSRLTDLVLSPQQPLLASLAENEIKLHEFQDLKEVFASFLLEEPNQSFSKLQWTDDGQLLSTSLKNGGLITFLIQLPQLGCSYDTRVAYLTSLMQITVCNDVAEEAPIPIDCPIEPSFVTLGPSHLAVGMNNRLWFTRFMDPHRSFTERSYIGTISDAAINNIYCAVLSNGRIELHQIENTNEDQHLREYSFPDEGQQEVITCLALTDDYLIYGTKSGSIVYFYLEDWEFVNEYKHVVGITRIFPDRYGTRLVFSDEKSDGFLYNPVSDVSIDVAKYPPSTMGLLWDVALAEKHVFVIYDKEKLFSYAFYRDTCEGPKCVFLETTELPYGHKPLVLHDGVLSCLNTTGKTKSIKLLSHSYSDDQEISEEELKTSFQKNLALCHLKNAWLFATAIDKPDVWSELANSALFHLDIGLAIRAFQQTKNLAMICSLQAIQEVEDRNLLVGYIHMYKENYSVAQDFFLKSSEPKAALEMRCDLLQWNQALELAKTLSEDRLPYISKQYAEQLEFIGDYGNSLIHFERAITNQPELHAHDEQCQSGLARTALHTGDVRRGIKLAQSSDSRILKNECAEILETLKLFSEAGTLYEQSESWEKAANCFMRVKNWEKVGFLIAKIPQSTRLHSHYAKAREADGHFKESALAYERAQDFDNAIRIYLEHLKQPEEAVRVANESDSVEGAKLVAKFFQKAGDYGSALQFLVMSKCNDEAYLMAKDHGQMDQYSSVIGDNGTTEDYLKVANFYEHNNEHFKAGVFFMKAKEFTKSLDHLLLCPTSQYPDGDNINMAIKVVSMSKRETLIQRLHSYLMGEIDDEPKEAKFLFSMYLSLGQYQEASQTAILIAREDQTAGNYRSARDLLFRMYKDLVAQGIKIPREMKQSLMLLHSYLLVKLQVKKGDHESAARLLIRVSTNISKFPSHTVPILTSTIIECQRSGLKKSAFEFAAMLMRSENRQYIDSKWKKKIESIVRKPERSELDDEMKPCPYCSFMLPKMRLDCPECKNQIPFCILTGQHMVKNDWTECVKCKFPALYSSFKSFIQSGELCPLCGEENIAANISLYSEAEVQTKLPCQ